MTSEAASALYFDTERPLDERVEDLLRRMTREEKINLMQHEAKGSERLGIPDYNWWNECLHGVARAGRATVFPQAIGLAASFDEDLVARVASAIGDEGRAKHHAAAQAGNRGQFFGLTYWTPNVNIFRDPRWGRGQETYGEDPYLTGRLGSAFIRGLQGDHPKYLKAAACAKHFAVHSGPEAERHSFDARCSTYDLWDTYLPAFKDAVDAGVESFMGAYNRTNGEPCCAHSFLIKDVLRGRWKFDGHFVSDCWALRDFHQHHGVTANPLESAALAVRAGCDLNCGDTYELLGETLNEGLLEEADLDPCVRRLLRTFFRLGFFDPPAEVPYAQTEGTVVCSPAHAQLALEAARKGITLLKNDNHTLPLADVGNLLIVGTSCANIDVLLGNYYGTSDRMVTVVEGISRLLPPGMRCEYRPGMRPEVPNVNQKDFTLYESTRADAIIVSIGLSPWLEGEEGDALASSAGGDLPDPSIPPHQVDYLRRLKKGGAKLIALWFGGGPLILGDIPEIVDALLWVGYPGQAGGEAIAQIVFGHVSPSGKLPFTVYQKIEDLPPFSDYSMRGRTYRYFEKEPVFPFGFGLGYSETRFSDLAAPDEVVAGDPIALNVTLANLGSSPCDEVAQVYLRPINPAILAPNLALKAFRRVSLDPGEALRLEFTLSPDALRLVTENGDSVFLPGEYELVVASHAPLRGSEKLPASSPVRHRLRLVAPR
ncbi:MAG: glycoside hydrolase family 3 N-terminal domain-containing protein [Opitutales bacterium]